MSEVNIDQGEILASESEDAKRNLDTLSSLGVRSFDIMGATGSGKTALIETIAHQTGPSIKIGAIAGDVTGSADYDRFREAGISAHNLNTEGQCHLDAELVGKSLQHLPLKQLDILFIENVGNLICPASFPLGVEREIVIISVTEGEDMVRKQPKMFMQSDLLVINKIDLADIIGVNPEIPREDFLQLKPDGDVIFSSAAEGTGIDSLFNAMELNTK